MRRRNIKKPIISALEQRILFDGAAVTTALDVLDNSSFNSSENQGNNNSVNSEVKNDATKNNAENQAHEAQAVQGFERSRREVAFVDVSVKDFQTLVDGVRPNIEVYLVESMNDIKSILSSNKDIDAIHILSHGKTGEITVGNDVLNLNSIDNYASLLESIKTSLTQDGDLLLYGCDVAANGNGQEFIDTLANITQADVAASNDPTGAAALGGDWDLEVSTGSIESDIALNDEIVGTYDGTLAIVTTNFELSLNSDSTWERPTPGARVSGDNNYGTFKSVKDSETSNTFNYAYVEFKPKADGVYDIFIRSSAMSDPMIFLYNSGFNSSTPTSEFIVGDDDSGDNYGLGDVTKPLFPALNDVYLLEGHTYFLVMSSYAANDSGDIAFSVTGPDNVDIIGGTLAGEIPTIQAQIPTQNLTEGFSNYTIDLKNYFNDKETSDVNLNYTVSGNNGINVSINGGIATISSSNINYYGSETLKFTATDEAGGSISQNATFNVAAVNDAPTLSNVTKTLTDTIAKDTFANITGNLITSDVDDTNFTYDFSDGTTSQVGSYGTLSISSSGAYTYVANADAINALSGNTTDTFTIRTTDSGGGAGAGAKLTSTASFTVNIIGVNDTPINSVSSSQTVNEDATLVFNSTNSNLISVSDVDSSNVTVALAVSNGVLNLGNTSNITISSGSNASNTITFIGTKENVNAALNGLTYKGNQDFFGSDTLTVTTSDGNTSDTDTVAITINSVNDAPTISITESSVGFTETTDLVVQNLFKTGNITVTDIDEAGVVSLTPTSNNDILWSAGTINETLKTKLLAGFSLDSAAKTWTYDVKSVDLNFLAEGETITFSYTVTATDSQNATATDIITITITGTNDAPFFGDGTETNTDPTANPFDKTIKPIFGNADFEDGLTGWDNNDATSIVGKDKVSFDALSSMQMTEQVKAILGNGDQMTWEVTAAGNKMVKLQATGDDTEFNADFQNISKVSNDSLNYIKNTFYESSSMKPTNMAYISKTFDAVKGDTYQVAWNYISGDYVPYNDGSVLSFVNNTDPSKTAVLDGIQAEVSLLGATNPGTSNYTTSSYGSTGWQTTTIQVLESGSYTLTMAVFNLGDTELNPYLYVDNIKGTTTLNGTEFAPLPKDTKAPAPAGEEVIVSSGLVESDASLADTNTIRVTDVDITDKVNITKSAVTSVQYDTDNKIMTSTIIINNEQLLNMLTITPHTPAIDATETTKDLTWSFNSGTEHFDYLAKGEKVVITYTITATDNAGETDTTDISVTIIGSNDTPVITVNASDSESKIISETNTTIATNGTLSVFDADISDTSTVSKINVVSSGTTTGLASNNAALLNMLAVDSGNIIENTTDSGKINWSFNSGSEYFNYLAAGETLTLSYTVRVTDSKGATSDKVITVNIQGTNDAPDITVNASDSESKTISETNTTIATNGTLSVFDADISDTSIVSKIPNPDINIESIKINS